MLTRSAVRRFSTEKLKVVNNVAKQQFTISMSGEDAVIGYKQSRHEIKFVHTDVPPLFQGKGVAKILAKHAFEHAQQNKLDVICHCSFLAKYYENNRNKFKDLKVKIDLNPEKE